MSKKKDIRRKSRLESKSKSDSICFQVDFEKRKRGIGNDYDEIINKELEAIQRLDLVSDILTASSIFKEIREVLMINDEAERNSFNGSCVAYLLGITGTPPSASDSNSPFLEMADDTARHFQAQVYYDNEVRNKVIDWLKSKNYTVSTRLGQPILKLSRIVIEIGRCL